MVRLAVKVDVDTWLGAREGIPRLMEIFAARKIKASFYLSLGPDNSGRAVRRIFTRPGFLGKMIRTRAPGTYGLRTMFMGTLLPAPIISKDLAQTVRELAAAGHEVGLHAWDHVAWHDRLWRMGGQEVRAEIARGLRAFESIAGTPAAGFAAPAWRINVAALAALEKSRLTYISATRGLGPYWPSIFGHCFRLLEIPTTLPTADEMLGAKGITRENLFDCLLARLPARGLQVFTIHAEMEGRGLAGPFGGFLDACLERAVRFVRLIDVARELLAHPETVPAAEVIRGRLPGRPGRVCRQLS